MADETVQTIISISGNAIRLTAKQWMHIVDALIYRDEPNGFVITAFFTSKPEKFRLGRRRHG